MMNVAFELLDGLLLLFHHRLNEVADREQSANSAAVISARAMERRWRITLRVRVMGMHEAKLLRRDGQLAVAGKPYCNSASDVPRTADIDGVHVWMPT